MIVWGGHEEGNHLLNTGGIYDPSSDTWTTVNSTDPDTPQVRYLHSAVWTGSDMIIWGGQSGDFLDTGSRYDPLSDSWTATNISDPDMPSARYEHTAVWTGIEMIVFGGRGNGGNFCGSYSP
jgi:N-acetylneuraminic acid mutarotase